MLVRLAERSDLNAINGIYNAEVEASTATFDTEPMSEAARMTWLSEHGSPRHPAVVAVLDEAVVGWASTSAWSQRCAYARTAEVSVYVEARFRGRGVGRALLMDLIQRGRAAGLSVLLARVSLGEGPASVALHEAVGFSRIGTMRRVGEKFGRVLDVELLDLQLDDTRPAVVQRDT